MTNSVDMQRIHGYCSLCVARCGVVATAENGRFTRLDPDPSHPTGQAICAKGRAAPELVYHPERLTHPLRRTRPKGDADPGWERISWDEALDLTAASLRRIAEQQGPEAVVVSVSSPSTTAIADSVPFIQRLVNAFGSSNMLNNTDVCGWGRAYATQYAYGVGVVGAAGGAMPDIAQSGCLILWGYNPSLSRLPHATAIIEAKQRGMKLIVIDPRRSGLVGRADIWLRVRPGSDGALALGLANLMMQRGWMDVDFMRNWTNGPLLVRSDTGRMLTARDLSADGDERHLLAWDQAAEHPIVYDALTGHYHGDATRLALEGEYRVATTQGDVVCQPAFALYASLCQRYSPEVVESTCWIPRAQLEETARLLWESRPVSYYAWSGHEQQANVTDTARAMSLLYALTGCFDAPGGNVVLPSVPAASINGADLPAAQQRRPNLGIAERPLGLGRWNIISTREFYRAVLDGEPYPVKGLLGFGANILLAKAEARRGREALAALDFYAHADLFMTPTAALADVVLPVASAFEREALKFGFEISAEAQSLVQLRPAVAPPPGEARSDTQIVFDLAHRLGLSSQFWDGDIDAGYRQQLEPSGIRLETLRSQPQGVRVPLQAQYFKHAALNEQGHPRGFATPSRRIELYSETFLQHGYAPLPDFIEPVMSPYGRPDLAERFPLVLTCAKSTFFCQSQHRALPSLRRRALDPEVTLHPEAAQARQIAQGDWVSIETPQGSMRARANLNADIDPRVAVGEHGWWQGCAELGAAAYDPFEPEGSNYNLLIDGEIRDPVSGTGSYRAHLCEIRPAP